MRAPEEPSSQISQRVALLVLLGLVCAAATAGLTWVAGRHAAESALGGLLAFGGAYAFFDRFIR
jgi:hypothetical protein